MGCTVAVLRCCTGFLAGAVAWAHHRERAGWADASSPCPSIRIEVWLRWFPVPTGCDHDCRALVPTLCTVLQRRRELLAERGTQVDHVTIFRWVQHFTPLLIDAARPCRHAPGARWFVDETYAKIAGRWVYLYRAINQFGQSIDVLVAEKRDLAATRRFFTRALEHGPSPTEVTTDHAAALCRAKTRHMAWYLRRR
jgi:hypothetical protein